MNPPVVSVDVRVPDAEILKSLPKFVATTLEPLACWITKLLFAEVDGVGSGATTHCVLPATFSFHTIVPRREPPIVTVEVEPSAELKVEVPFETPDATTSPALLTSTEVMSSKFDDVTFCAHCSTPADVSEATYPSPPAPAVRETPPGPPGPLRFSVPVKPPPMTSEPLDRIARSLMKLSVAGNSLAH